jgi:hypothetical protein
MAKTTVEQTNNWGVTRVFGKRVINLTRGASAHVTGQGDQPQFEFDYDNLPPFFSTTSNANYRFAPGAVVTNLVFHTQEAWIGGTNLQVKATASDGSSVNLGAAQVTADLATKGKAVIVDLGATGTSTGLSQPLFYHYGNTTSATTIRTNRGRSSGVYASFTLGNVGTPTNATGPTTVARTAKTITATGTAQISTAQSKFGGASALFDGGGDYLRTVSSLDIGTNDFTFECWDRTASAGKVIFDNRSSNQPAVFIVNGSGRIGYFDPTLGSANGSTTSITNSTWNHLAWVRNGSSFKMFVNGNEEYTTNSFSSNLGTSRDLWIGSSYVLTDQFPGNLDEIRISNNARYTANFTAPTAAFTNDSNTILLIHANGTNGSTVFLDDNAL